RVSAVVGVRRQVDTHKATKNISEADGSVTADEQIGEAAPAKLNWEGRGDGGYRIVSKIEICPGEVPVIIIGRRDWPGVVICQGIDVHTIPAGKSQRVVPGSRGDPLATIYSVAGRLIWARSIILERNRVSARR